LGWTAPWRKQDWRAVWLGLLADLVAYAPLFGNVSSIGWLAGAPT
jgi:hypothetical protein